MSESVFLNLMTVENIEFFLLLFQEMSYLLTPKGRSLDILRGEGGVRGFKSKLKVLRKVH